MILTRLLISIILVLYSSVSSPAQTAKGASPALSVVRLETNATSSPLGIDDPKPRLSWRLESDKRGALQQRARVLVASKSDLLKPGQADVWDSGEIQTDNPWLIYAGPALTARTRYYWSVEVWTTDGVASARSEPAWFEMGLLADTDWQADWIAGPERSFDRKTPEEGIVDDADIRSADEFCRPPMWPVNGFFANQIPNNEGECREIRPAPMLRKSFQITQPVAKARIYSTGLGYNDLTVNGSRTSDSVLDPAFTSFNKTVFYTTRDATSLLRQGANVVAATLGSGQYDGSARTWDWAWDIAEWRATPRLRLQLHIQYQDGTEQVVISDTTWQVSTDGPTRYDSYYLGETYDARREIPGWNAPGFDASGWSPARPVDAPAGKVHAQPNEPIRVVETLTSGKMIEPVKGIFVYDTGQNLTGWARVRVNAPAGTPIELFYSEKKDSLGRASNEVGFTLLGGQLQTDYYIAKGAGDEVWTPRFSYKGFRYLQLSSPEAQPLPENVTVQVEAVEVLRTGFAETSSFESSSDLLNKIHRNTKWAVASNMHGITTDTPIYEKNGWTGDAQLTSGTASLLFDTERLYTKQFQDMLDAQTEQGEVSLLSPGNGIYGYVGEIFKSAECCGATPAWDAFWFVLPWEGYRHYGDIRGLEKTYPAMQRYLDNWIPQWTDKDGDEYAYTLTSGLGDWLPPTGTPTNTSLVTTASYAQLVKIAAKTAEALGKPEDAKRYQALFDKIRTDFNKRFLSQDGVYRDSLSSPYTQTAQILPLAFGLAPEDHRTVLAAGLMKDITEAHGGNGYVGVVGARYLLPVLDAAGYSDVAFQTATQTDYPGWGYWIEELGWTGLGESWEADTRSRNHHFYGAIVQWMYEDLAGVWPIEPGYKKIAFKPSLPAGLAELAVSYESVRGRIATSWHKSGGALEISVTVPPTATGLVYLPAQNQEAITEIAGGTTKPIAQAEAVEFVGAEGDRLVYEVGSGSYRFRISQSAK